MLSGKVALVTGAGRGIGKAIALALGQRKAFVIINYNGSEKQAKDVNLKGCFNTMRHLSRQLLKQKGGKIINITSVAGVMGNPGQANYCASKAGIIGLTKSAARELGSRGITVNAVAPGLIDTEMTESLPENIKEAMKEQTLLKRMGQAKEVAAAVAFLASPEADYITGQVISVDGGMAL